MARLECHWGLCLSPVCSLNKIKVWKRLHSFWRFKGRICFLAFRQFSEVMFVTTGLYHQRWHACPSPFHDTISILCFYFHGPWWMHWANINNPGLSPHLKFNWWPDFFTCNFHPFCLRKHIDRAQELEQGRSWKENRALFCVFLAPYLC